MAIEDIALLWCSRVDAEVKKKFPIIDDALAAVNDALITLKAMRKAYVIAVQAYKTYQVGLEIASAATAGQAVSLAAAKLGVAAQDELFEQMVTLLNKVGLEASAGFADCGEIKIPKNIATLSALDKEFADAEALLAKAQCNVLADLFSE